MPNIIESSPRNKYLSVSFYVQIIMSATNRYLSVTSMPTVGILTDLIFVRVKLDFLEMGKHAAVR